MDDDDNDDIRDLGRSLQDLYNEQLKSYDAFDAKSQQLGQNHPGNDTIHRGRKSTTRFAQGGKVSDKERQMDLLFSNATKNYEISQKKLLPIGPTSVDTIHRSKKSSPVKFSKGGMVCREYKK